MLKNFVKIIPELPESFNRNYYIKSTSVNVLLLKRSGYKILHRPYFAMKDSTHDAITLNPHKKVVVDAAPTSAQVICFKDFLKLFENINI